MVVSVCLVLCSSLDILVSLVDYVMSAWSEENCDTVIGERSSHFISLNESVSEIDEGISFIAFSL